jgi:transposase
LFYHLSLESFVPLEHPLRAIWPLIDDGVIRRACQDLYAPIGRPSIPPEQLFLALVGGYLLGITSERKLVMELQCNMALRWLVGLNLDQDAWDASRFSQSRRRRFDESGVLEHLFDDTLTRAMAAGLVSRHVSADGTLVRANASFKSFEPIEVALDPAEYKRRLRAQDRAAEGGPVDPGNPAVDFRGEKHGNATHRSVTDPDCRFVSKGTSGTGANPGYTVNAVMENRHRVLLGLGVEIFQSSTAEKAECLALLDRAKRRLRFRPTTLGADKGFFHEDFLEALFARGIEPHVATQARGGSPAHTRVRMPTPSRVSPVATVPEAHRGTLRRGQGLAWPAALPAPRADPGPAGNVPDRLGAESQTPGEAPRPGLPPRMNPRQQARRSADRGVRPRDETSGRR